MTRAVLPHYYTYSLGRSLHVPLTSRCNSHTLPQLRGPGFVLPPDVVGSLLRFRDLELDSQAWAPWCAWLDTQEAPQFLPDPLEPVERIEHQKSIQDALEEEIQALLVLDQDYHDDVQWDVLQFGGEGEPLLNPIALKNLTKTFSAHIPIQVRTNGLVTDCSPLQLLEWGVSSVSVTLLTHNPIQHESLLQPLVPHGHDQVCRFLQQSVECGLQVQVTAVDRPHVDKIQTQALATRLGVEGNIRWRPYFS
jgi:organic radical activating enzyme